MAVDIAQAYVSILPSTKGLGRELIADLTKDGDSAGQGAGESFLSGMSGKFKAGGVAVAAVLGASVIKGFMDAIAAEDVTARFEASLGVSPERAGELGAVAAGAYRDGWGSSLEEVGGAVAALEASFGENIDPAALEPLTGQALALADVFGIDVEGAIASAGQLLESGLAANAQEAFDLIVRGAQEVPPALRGDLLDATDEYGTFFDSLGISGPEAFKLLTDAADGGVYGIDKTGDALKELTIRATDMSATSVDAYEAAGLNADEMAARFVAGGDTARGALGDLVDGLLAIEDPVEQSNAAIALFGAPLEDLSVTEIPGFLEGLRDMEGGLDNVDGAAASMADTLGSTTSAKIETFKRQVLGGLADFAANNLIPAFEGVVGWFQTNWPTIQGVVQGVVDWMQTYVMPVVQTVAQFFVDRFAEAKAWVDENWPAIKATIDSTVQAIKTIIETTIALIKQSWELWGDEILAYARSTWEFIKGSIESTINIVRGIIQTVTSLIRGDWEGVWNGIKTFFDGIWTGIKSIVQGAIDTIKTVLSAAWSAITYAWAFAWGEIKRFFSDLWEDIKGIVSDAIDAVVGVVGGIASRVTSVASGAFDGVKNAFRDAINWILRKWNGLSFELPSFGGWGPIPAFGGQTLQVPQIPLLARGVRNFTGGLAVVGERGPELVSLPAGADVYSNRQSSAMGWGAPTGAGATINVYSLASAYEVVNLLRQHVEENGPLPASWVAA